MVFISSSGISCCVRTIVSSRARSFLKLMKTTTSSLDIVSLLYAFPPFITVHGIVPAYKRCHPAVAVFQVADQFSHEALAASRVCIAAVSETVDIYFFQTVIHCHVAE